MRLKVGPYILPQNEAVASISYSPVYDVTRRVIKVRERWDISGRIVLQSGRATQEVMTSEILRRSNIFQGNVESLVFLQDDEDIPTAMRLLASQCLLGPYRVDSSLPNEANDVYSTGQGYRVVYEAEKLASGAGSGLLEFTESIQDGEGGEEHVYVGGAVNLPERQIAFANKPYRYTQSGSAVGLLDYPRIPPPIWPFARMKKVQVNKQSPRVRGAIDTEYPISWSYEFAWHSELRGVPHRLV